MSKYDLIFSIIGVDKDKKYQQLKNYCENKKLHLTAPHKISEMVWHVLVVCDIDHAININNISRINLIERQGKMVLN